jgi:hypothetical protein
MTGNGERRIPTHVPGKVFPEFSDANGFKLCSSHSKPPMCTQEYSNIVFKSGKSKGRSGILTFAAAGRLFVRCQLEG